MIYYGKTLTGSGAKLTAGQFGGMTVSDAKRLKALESENAKLKRLLAESMLDIGALKDVIGRKW